METPTNYKTKGFDLYISTGYRIIMLLFKNDFIRVNSVPGVGISYSLSYSEYKNYNPPQSRSELVHSYGINISEQVEIEVTIGKFLSLPADTICIASAIGVMLSSTAFVHYYNGAYMSCYWSESFGTASSGSTITSLALR